MDLSSSLRSLIGSGGVVCALAIALAIPVASGLQGVAQANRQLEMLARLAMIEMGATPRTRAEAAAHQTARFADQLDLVGLRPKEAAWSITDGDGPTVAAGADLARGLRIERATVLPAGPDGPATLHVAISMRPLADRIATLTLFCALIGVAVGLLARAAGLTLLDRILRAQKAENFLFHTAIDNISQGLCFFDGQQRLIVCNRQYIELYQLPPEFARPGTTLRQIVDARFASGFFPVMSRDEYVAWRSTIAISNEASDSIVTLRNGQVLAIHHQPMPDGGWVATHADITAQKLAVEQIERLAHHDSLTGLPNRALFRSRLVEAIGRCADGGTLAILCIDLDRFKVVNDTLGHPVGDGLLCKVAHRLQGCVRQNDLLARLGGDEFAIIQTGAAQPAAAQALARRLVAATTMPCEVEQHRLLVGTSVGIAVSPDDGLDPDELLRKADLALYEAKAAGRGTFRIFDAPMGVKVESRRTLEADLQRAAGNGELELHYQPIVAIGDARAREHRPIVGFEALLRWRHPVRGMVMPDRFIPLAEETGLIEPIGEWVLDQAFAEAARWPSPIGVAVNLSPQQLKSGNLVRAVRGALERSGIAATRVELEITESVLLAENSINLAILHDLRALGVRISLDDFGVGYSSLSYLRSFPFKKIKIDRSFIRELATSREARAIVEAIAMLGRSLGMVVTAEGVEDEEQLTLLHELRCDEAQGYLMSAPRPACEIDAMLRNEHRLRLVATAA